MHYGIRSRVLAIGMLMLIPHAKGGVDAPPHIEQVIVVFKTHFDIGYTDMAYQVVHRYRTDFIDRALKVVDQSRDLPTEQQFVWTLPGWPMHKIMEDWPGQTQERQQRLLEAFKTGRFVTHGLPFTTHTELLEAEDLVRGMVFSSNLARKTGFDLPRDAKMTDVPSHTWIMPTLLKHAGIEFLHIGCNWPSHPVDLPALFWWEGADGSRLLTMYSRFYGTELTPAKEWPFKTWLALIHTGDNQGPPKPEDVKKLLDQAAQQLPGVNVRIGRLSDFADAILAEEAELPVIRGDAPDSWIHGPMSDPAGAKIARNLRPLIAATESLNTQLRLWNIEVPNGSAPIAKAYEQSLLYGEHTWGLSPGAKSFDAAFQQDQAKGRFQRSETSWDEHTAYIETAQQIITPLLATNLHALAQSVNLDGKRIVVYNPLPWKREGLVCVEWGGSRAVTALRSAETGTVQPVETSGTSLRFIARDVPPMGYRTYVPVKAELAPSALNANVRTQTIENRFFKVVLDPARGVVSSLVEKRTGHDLVDASTSFGLGQYFYERFDADQLIGYCDAYHRPNMRNFKSQHGFHPGIYKPGLPSAEEHPYESLSPHNFELCFESSPVSVTAVMEAQAQSDHPAVTTRITLYQNQPYVDLEMTLHNKPEDSWPEAGWLCLPLNVQTPQFRLGRIASIMDPAHDILPGANRHVLGLNSGMTVTDPQGRGAGLCALDSPLVSLDTPGIWKYALDFVPKRPIVFVNLFNNQWNTNFRLWNSGTWTSRVRLWPIHRYQPESSLITPASESRYPLLAAVAGGPKGTLPHTQSGLRLSRKGILVTALGANPDGKGTVLRLWEYAGQSGPCTVTLPEGLTLGQVQPIDLRGRNAGKPIPVKDRSFALDVQAFAPASFLIDDAARANGIAVSKD